MSDSTRQLTRHLRALRRALAERGRRSRLWVGDAAQIASPDDAYDAAFDFGVIHHVPDWQGALAEVARVLKPGGRFYGEEVLAAFTRHPLIQRLFTHPTANRFDAEELRRGLQDVGLDPIGWQAGWGLFAWFVAVKPDPSAKHGSLHPGR